MRAIDRQLATIVLLCVSMCLTGCGGAKGPPTGTVSGNVTLDGKPLETGSIAFIPKTGDAPTSGAKIVKGYYSATVPLGKKRIEIRAPKVVGQRKAYDTPDSPVIDIIEELIPARYNSTSELETEIATGSSAGDFKLISTPATPAAK